MRRGLVLRNPFMKKRFSAPWLRHIPRSALADAGTSEFDLETCFDVLAAAPEQPAQRRAERPLTGLAPATASAAGAKAAVDELAFAEAAAAKVASADAARGEAASSKAVSGEAVKAG